ncbi:patatin-domain-containing protein [Polyplosphaeria fusca]|uniref:Patatin-domain-containing protein n=1 Tax=Polyplosphaeria fusca TaxID=682080 RepID=A0A9P4R157_9PLEO|nr:patatin-domain-containing protein [Polyplosphaeria fusca]
MSFLCDTLLPGSAGHFIRGQGGNGEGDNTPKSGQSHAARFTPLIQLVRDPLGAIGGAVGSLSLSPEHGSSSTLEADRKQLLYLRMKNAESFEVWKAAATELDTLEGNDLWKNEDYSEQYNFELVAARLKELDDARLSCDVKRMLFLIRTSLTRGLGGMGDLRLYKHSHIGTKSLIERYIDSVQQTLTALLDVSAAQGDKCSVEPGKLTQDLLATRQSFGRSALLLSGGGTFGMNHIGVVKSLWKARLLPRIISGASAGSIVCAVLCSKTDAEIPDVLEEFCYGDLAVFEKAGDEDGLIKKVTRFLKFGALFDISHLVNVMRALLGDITFQESYNRTRRILNITVSSASLYELPRLLNYVTAPNVMIWSAVCASCSVPFVFSAASLLAKDPRTGKEVPWDPTPNAGFIDGSVDNDLPMARLAEMFNVNHFIVSQVNPHVVPFLAKEEEIVSAEAQQTSAVSAGPSWIHNMANLAKGEALHRLHVLAEMGIFPNTVTKARSVLNQRYSGDITIFPAISYAHFPKVLSNPTTEYMLKSMLTGERATWPKLSRVQNHVAIELAIDETIRKSRTRVVFSPSQVDLRLNNLTRPLSEGYNRAPPTKAGRPLLKNSHFDRSNVPSTLHSTVPSRGKIARRKANLHPFKPYLPTQPHRNHNKFLESVQFSSSGLDAHSSSTNMEESDTSSDEEFSAGTDTSEFLSSPSPPSSPFSAMPVLWPSTRQVLFPSTSQPATPSMGKSPFGQRTNSLMNLTMTGGVCKPPSSPEIRYKRLFHPPTDATTNDATPVQLETRKEVEKTFQQINEPLFPNLRQTETLPETQALPPGIQHSDFAPERHSRLLRKPLSILSPVFSPALTPQVDTEAENQQLKLPTNALSRQEKKEQKEAKRERRHSRRGSAQGAGLNLLLDISGTRGMLLRRKKSEKKIGTPT